MMTTETTTYGPTVDIHGAADMMKVHSKTVLDLIGAGVLRAGKIGKAYVLLRSDVLKHIEQTIIKQTSERMGATYKRRRKASPQLLGQH